ncbi:DUF2786 domain-containing protein [Erwinia tracheiphila]|uniref:DUF2786 domain-containing protein n=1 Tax=Erwinia tracheiphila TaxID=65700 RepID=UPI001F258C2C|nr:DUF2786 domain-containing protein [Erwinia tracheiphila]UIA94703.1 DUF2786 domain-containing protein [Erwinia tracheiphila]
MSNAKYLAKIKKLMRLARGTSNPEEAASAMSKAQAFMREYGLSENEVELSDVREARSAGAPSNAENMPDYMNHLCNVVCRTFGVDAYYTRQWRRSGSWKRIVVFYGPGERGEIASYAFDVLTRQLRAARRGYQQRYCKRCKPSTRVARGDQFCEGWGGGAAGVLEAFSMKPEEKNCSSATPANFMRNMTSATPQPAKHLRVRGMMMQRVPGICPVRMHVSITV